MRYLPILLTTLFLTSPGLAQTEPAQNEKWFFDLETPGGPLPIEVHGPILSGPWGNLGEPNSKTVIVNGAESISIGGVIVTDGGSFSVSHHFAGFDSQLRWHGASNEHPRFWGSEWIISRKSGKTTIPIKISDRSTRFPLPDTPPAITSGRYRVTFASSPDDPAVGLFTINQDGTASGTFLTTTGDYRYLAGNAAGDTLKLSTFDGAHAFNQDMATNFFSTDALEHRAVIIAKSRLEVMDEQGTDATDENTERYVNDPVDTEVEDGKDEQGCVDEDKEVVGPVPPFPERSSLFLDVQVIQHQDAERNGDV